jgi:hypothetical protein
MRRGTMFMSAAALVLSAVTAMAQTPNFAGKWTLQVDPNAAAGRGGRGGGGGGLGMEFTATQDAKTLTITRTQGTNEIKTVYNLDGTDSKNMVAGRGGRGGDTPPPPTEQISKAKWEGGKLVITTTFTMGDAPVSTTMSLSLNAGGDLVVERTQQGRGGGAPTTVTQTYKKG